tara:strand:- start:1070 stop:1993 length:924 start_codon:yes stop_codon:yes gene_type:complete
MLGLGAAALLFMNRGGSEEDQVDQLAGAAMMASGEGTAPDAPFQAYSAPSNPSFFFNEGGQMAKVSPDSRGAADKAPYTKPELEFQVAPSNPPVGTTDISPTTPEFAGTGTFNVASAAIWDDQAAIADANFMPLLAIQDSEGGAINILGSNVDISTLSSKEQFRAVNLETGFGFTTTGEVLGEYVRGFIDNPAPAYTPSPGITAEQSTDEDIGVYPGGVNKPELEFTVARSFPPAGTSDISPTTPQYQGPMGGNIVASTIWDQPAFRGGVFGSSSADVGMTSNIKSTVRPEPSVPAWAGGDNWWDEG